MSKTFSKDVQLHIISNDCKWLQDNYPKLDCDCSKAICTAKVDDETDPALNEAIKRAKGEPGLLEIDLNKRTIRFASRMWIKDEWFNVQAADYNMDGNIGWREGFRYCQGVATCSMTSVLNYFDPLSQWERYLVETVSESYQAALKAVGLVE